MATIRTAIQIQDGLSSAFKSMNNAMQIAINSFESLQRVSGNAVDSSSIITMRQELSRAESAFNEVEQQIREADQQQQRFNQSVQGGTSAANGLLGKIGAIVGAYLSIQSIKAFVNLSDEMTNTTARLNLMNDGLQTTAELQQMIYESARRTHAPYQATADVVGKLGMQARAAFGNNQEIVAFAEQLNKTFAIAGTSVVGVESVMLQLTQAMAAGKLQGEELNAILDNAQPIVANIQRYLEDAFNMDASNIKKLASEGIITAEIIKNAMFYAAKDTNAAFENMPITWGQMWVDMKDIAINAFTPILQKINEVANSDRMKSFMDGITKGLYAIATVATWAFDMMVNVGSFLYDHWSILGPIILGAGGSVLTFIGLLAALQAGTMLAAGATWVWNAALAANPIVWVVAGVVALIGIIYLAVEAINHFAGTSINATGLVAGLFLALGATIANVFIYIWNVATEVYANIYNVAATVSEGMVNVFSGDLSAIGRMFAQLGDNVLGILQSIARGIDFVFGSNLASAVGGWRNKLESWSGEVLGENKYQIDRMVASDFQMKTFDIAGAYKTGYDWGANLFSGTQLKQQGEQPSAINWSSLMNSLGGLGGVDSPAAKQTAGNTAKMAKSIDMSGEDLKYLRDLSEREAINKFTTAEIKVDMSGMNNNINNEMDLDGIVHHFVEKTEEAMQTIAEGV